jgi:hypothetical protein
MGTDGVLGFSSPLHASAMVSVGIHLALVRSMYSAFQRRLRNRLDCTKTDKMDGGEEEMRLMVRLRVSPRQP